MLQILIIEWRCFRMLSSSKVVLSRQFMIYFRTKLGQIVCRILDLIDGGCVGRESSRWIRVHVGWLEVTVLGILFRSSIFSNGLFQRKRRIIPSARAYFGFFVVTSKDSRLRETKVETNVCIVGYVRLFRILFKDLLYRIIFNTSEIFQWNFPE